MKLLEYDWTLDAEIFWNCMIASLFILFLRLIYDGLKAREIRKRNKNNEL